MGRGPTLGFKRPFKAPSLASGVQESDRQSEEVPLRETAEGLPAACSQYGTSQSGKLQQLSGLRKRRKVLLVPTKPPDQLPSERATEPDIHQDVVASASSANQLIADAPTKNVKQNQHSISNQLCKSTRRPSEDRAAAIRSSSLLVGFQCISKACMARLHFKFDNPNQNCSIWDHRSLRGRCNGQGRPRHPRQ